MGYQAGLSITTASRNIAIGSNALRSLSFSNSGSDWISGNVAIGYNALQSLNGASASEGATNTVIGSEAGTSMTSGAGNTLVGYGTGSGISTGSFNTLLGRFAGLGTGTLTYATAIGSGASVNCSNCMAPGGNGSTSRTKVGINNSNPAYTLHVTQIPSSGGIALTGRGSTWDFAVNSDLNLSFNTTLRGTFSAITGAYTVGF